MHNCNYKDVREIPRGQKWRERLLKQRMWSRSTDRPGVGLDVGISGLRNHWAQISVAECRRTGCIPGGVQVLALWMKLDSIEWVDEENYLYTQKESARPFVSPEAYLRNKFLMRYHNYWPARLGIGFWTWTTQMIQEFMCLNVMLNRWYFGGTWQK